MKMIFQHAEKDYEKQIEEDSAGGIFRRLTPR